MKKIIRYLILGFTLLIFMTACGAEENLGVPEKTVAEDPDAGTEETVEETEETAGEISGTVESVPEEKEPENAMECLKQAVNDFSEKLYNAYDGEKNLFFSPFSIESAVSLADLAAEGDTAEGIEKALEIKDFDGFKAGMKKFDSREQSESAYLKTANGLFIDKSLSLSSGYAEDFEKPAKEYFGGEFRQMDFKDVSSAREEINAWVKDATEDMIPDYRSSVDSDTVADILNAVYFYGEWEKKFAYNDTWKETFHGLSGDKDTDMMHMSKKEFRYFSAENGIKAVALPYAESSYEMDLIMYADPEKKDVSGIFKEVPAQDILDELDRAEKVKLINLIIPKFKLDLELDGLKEKLISFGMEKAFSNEADLSKLADNIKLTDICHRAVLEVDEEGSRAAAVTEVMVVLTALPPDDGPKEEFIADRPFVFFIRDRESGVILFTGRFSAP